MANKITKREVINAMLQETAIKGNQMYVDYLTHELELMDNKKSNKKMTETQVANVAIKNIICGTLAEVGKAVTISELQVANAELAQYSTSKLSALMRQLVVEEGRVIKTIDKKRSLFSLVESEDTAEVEDAEDTEEVEEETAE